MRSTVLEWGPELAGDKSGDAMGIDQYAELREVFAVEEVTNNSSTTLRAYGPGQPRPLARSLANPDSEKVHRQ